MKNEIIYNYKIEPLSIHQKEKKYYFSSDSNTYLFVQCEDINLINRVYEFRRKLENINYPFHEIILNIENKPYTIVNAEAYVLMKINVQKNLITLDEVLALNSIYINEKNNVNWGNLWTEKVDSFEYQINQMGKEYKLLRESFSYYIGIAETAIVLYNLTEKKDLVYSLNHKRVMITSTNYELYDPFNMIIDLRFRDICDYFNSCFFSNKDVYKMVDAFFTTNIFNKSEKNLIFARILFPTYYFDLYEKIINNEKEEIEINKILKRVAEYEKFILYVYNVLNINNELFKIEWLKKIM